MITGDSKPTAVAIARDVNIFSEEDVASGKAADYAFTGSEFFRSLSDEDQLTKLKEVRACVCVFVF